MIKCDIFEPDIHSWKCNLISAPSCIKVASLSIVRFFVSFTYRHPIGFIVPGIITCKKKKEKSLIFKHTSVFSHIIIRSREGFLVTQLFRIFKQLHSWKDNEARLQFSRFWLAYFTTENLHFTHNFQVKPALEKEFQIATFQSKYFGRFYSIFIVHFWAFFERLFLPFWTIFKIIWSILKQNLHFSGIICSSEM